MKITLSRSQWEIVGKKAGWIKTAYGSISDDPNYQDSAEESTQRTHDEYERLKKYVAYTIKEKKLNQEQALAYLNKYPINVNRGAWETMGFPKHDIPAILSMAGLSEQPAQPQPQQPAQAQPAQAQPAQAQPVQPVPQQASAKNIRILKIAK